MPHCTLEYSANISDRPDFQALLHEIHQWLAGTGEFQLADIKSRVVRHDTYLVGDGDLDRAFVTMELCIMGGRDDMTKAALSSGVSQILARHFPRTLVAGRSSLTVRITDLHRASYTRSSGDPR